MFKSESIPIGYSIFDDTMADMTWPQIEKEIKSGSIVLLPTGVIEEHGPHMKLGVDIFIPLAISRLTKRELNKSGIGTLITPPFFWGINTVTGIFPGSFTTRKETTKAIIYDILFSLKRWGVKYVFIIHWHAEYQHNHAILEAVKEARANTGLNIYSILNESDVERLGLSGNENYIIVQKNAPSVEPPGAKYVDAHAGSMETGIMAYYFPKEVNTMLARTLKYTKINRDDLKTLGKAGSKVRKLIPLGYFGNPAAFDKEAGRRLVERNACDFAALIKRTIEKDYKYEPNK